MIRLKLASRILAATLVPCVVFTLAVVGVYRETSRLQHTIVEAERADDIVERSLRLQLHVAQLQRAARGSLLKPDDPHLEAWTGSRRQADEDLQALRQLVRDPAQLSLLSRIAELSARIAESTRQQLEQVRAGRAEAGVTDFRSGHSEELYRSFSDLVEQFFAREAAIEEQAKRDELSGIESVIRIMLASLALALVVSLAAGLWLARQTTRSLRELVAAVAASSNQIAATTRQHESAMAQQASSVTETTATVEEMVATARINAEQADLANRAAGDAQATTQQGLELVTHNENDMATMEATMNRLATQVVGLSEQAAQIGEISRVVGELAAETNMLALNAAVEAARAGEQGRGFAVVAGEIRKLADQSRRSAERANQIVGQIQKVTDGMVLMAEEGSKTTHSAADSARQASHAFGKVIHLADGVAQNAQQVLLNSKQQAVALAQIDIAMKTINQGAREMSTGTVQIRDGIGRLAGMADDLGRML